MAALPPAAKAAPAALHIAQVGFGYDARFTRCTEPACPPIAPKAFASASPTPAPITAMPPPAARAAAAPNAEAHLAATPAMDQPVVAPRTVALRFGTNSAFLTAAHKAILSNVIHEPRRTDRIVILGRTDDVGKESLNQPLALARALAIRDHLLDLVPDLPARIVIDARGRCCYAAPNDSDAGRAQNRRVELVYALRDEGAP